MVCVLDHERFHSSVSLIDLSRIHRREVDSSSGMNKDLCPVCGGLRVVSRAS